MSTTIAPRGPRLAYEIARQQRLAGDLARTQVEISTGKRLQQASDDPAAAARVARLARATANGDQWLQSLRQAQSLAAQADTALTSLAGVLTQANEAVVAGANGTLTAADRASYATTLRSLSDAVGAIRATRSSLDAPLFSDAPALAYRIDAATTVAPVAAAREVFDAGGVRLEDRLRSAADAVAGGDRAALADALQDLGRAVSEVADQAAAHGMRAGRIDSAIERNQADAIDLTVERASLEATDMTAAIARLNAQSLTLEAAQAAFARVNRRTLFDLLG